MNLLTSCEPVNDLQAQGRHCLSEGRSEAVNEKRGLGEGKLTFKIR